MIHNHSPFRRLLLSLLWIAFQFAPLPMQADYLPDAASHLGTIFINQDAMFTSDPLVTLSLQAISTGSGILQMQFSGDNENWSVPEPYTTNKQWQLTINAGDYPPPMNTVLKTVYARVKYGDGKWSKAFSDGIVFGKTAQDIPQVNEVWIMQARPTPFDGAQPLGSKLNPYIVPPGSNEAAFDTLMHTLASSYAHYRATPDVGQTAPPAVDGISVLFLHIGPGTYLTHGDNGGRGGTLSWGPTAGARIKGAGKDATLLKLVGGNTNAIAHVIGNSTGSGMGVYDNLEISDLTVDANMHEGGNKTSPWLRTGITLLGNNAQLRRLRVKGFGSRIAGMEPGGMTGYMVGNLYNFHIEDCEVVAPQTLNAYQPLMMGYHGGGKDTNGHPGYLHNVVIRNTYVNGLDYDQDTAINPYTSSFYERGTHGMCVGAVEHALIEDNLVEHTRSGYYNDSNDMNDMVVRNNHYRDVIAGLIFGTGVADNLIFSGNLVELDPHYYTTPVSGGTGPSDYGWRKGVILNEVFRAPLKRAQIVSNIFQFTDRTLPTPPLDTGFAAAALAGNAVFKDNTTWGIKNITVRWYQGEGPAIPYFENQIDIINPDQLPPVVMANNRREDGTIIEVYPYVLDQALPRLVTTPGQPVAFPAPLINGKIPAMVTGLPATNVIDLNGVFSWTPGANDIGRYVVSFYDSVNRTNDPRRTLIVVQSGLAEQDPLFFSTGLTAYWKLGEDIGNTFIDSSGNGNHITISDAARNYLALGVPSQRAAQKALHFENMNPIKTAALSIANRNASVFNGFPSAYQPYLQRSTVLVKPFTVSYWFNPEHAPANSETIFNYSSLLVCGVGPGPSTNKSLAEVFCYFGHSPDLTFYQGMHPPSIFVSPGQWHQLVFSYTGTGTKTYLDGRLRAEIPCGQIEDFSEEGSIYLGGGWGGDNYLGSLSDLAIWNRPLTDAEITRLYDNQRQAPAPSGVVPPGNLRFTPSPP